MWGNLKSELDTFTAGLAQFRMDLEKGERERLETVVKDMKEKGEALRANLRDFNSNLSTSVGRMLGELHKDRTEAARAWHEIISAVRSAAGAMTPTTPEEPVAAAEPEVVEPEIAEPEEAVQETEVKVKSEPDMPEEDDADAVSESLLESQEQEIDTQTLHEEIISLLEDTPDGLRMVEIAEDLRIENWRSLIPVMRELMDDGEVRKEDSTYFVA